MSAAAAAQRRTRFKPATRERIKLRMAIDGPSGSGKTYTALRLAHSLGKRIAVIDSEHGKAALYKGEAPDGDKWDFDHCILTTFSPQDYTAAIDDAAQGSYDVLVIDSLSHAWEGEDGALEIVSKKGGNSYTAWKEVTPIHRRMVEAILRAPMHVIVTMRSKTEYVLETNDKGKQVPRKVGMAPIQRPGMEYEFDVYGSMDWSNIMTVSKSRCPSISGAIAHKPGAAFMAPLLTWLETGTAAPVENYSPVMAQEDQIERIVSAIGELGKSLAKEKAMIFRRYAVDEFSRLTREQADDYEKRINPELEAKRKAASNGQPSANGQHADEGKATGETPANSQTLQEALTEAPQQLIGDAALAPDGVCCLQVLGRLAAARDVLFTLKGLMHAAVSQEQRDAVWQGIVQKRGVKTARAMSNRQALELLANLESEAERLQAASKDADKKH